MQGIVVLVLFIAFGIIRAIIQMSQENQRQQQQRQQQQQRPGQAEGPERQRRVQSEIDAFLQDVGAKPRQPENRPQSSRPKRRRPKQAPRPVEQHPTMQQRAAQRRATEDQARQVSKRPPGGSIAKRTIAHEIGSGIDRHVETYMAKQVDSLVDDRVQVDIVASVDSHLGRRRAELPEESQRALVEDPALALRTMLRDPIGVRNALLLNEILSRPRVLRD